MELPGLIISFVLLMFLICGVIIFFLHRALVSSTEGAVKRLNEEIAKANAKQTELSNKLKEADDELKQRQAEARDLANKMKQEAEEQSKAEREKIINEARKEGEDIIEKAQGAKDKIRQDLERENDMRMIRISLDVLNQVLSEKAKGVLHQTLVDEFINNLQNVDMSKISPDVKQADVISLTPLDDAVKGRISSIIKDKLKRDVSLTVKTDDALGGGLTLKFGSMALDGSVRSLIKNVGTKLAETIEAK